LGQDKKKGNRSSSTAIMGLHAEADAMVTGKWGNPTLRLLAGAFLAGFFWQLVYMWIRGQNLLGSEIGNPLIPAIVSGITYGVVAFATRKLSGGFVFFTNAFMTFFVCAAVRHFNMGRFFWHEGREKRLAMFAGSSPTIKKFHIVSVFWYLIGLFAGYYVGGLTAWGVLDSFSFDAATLNQTVAAPGPFPGGDSNFAGRAFLVEILVTFFIGVVTVSGHLMNESKWAASTGGCVVFVSILLTYNTSGSGLDTLAWFVGHLVVGTSGGNTAFTGLTLWWWAYTFGPMIGYFFGAVFALGLFMAYQGSEAEAITAGGRSSGMNSRAVDAVDFAANSYTQYPAPNMGSGYHHEMQQQQQQQQQAQPQQDLVGHTTDHLFARVG
jgi:hypothetical protein